jgi:2-amino-4-hydroxy-6-hydroxymethyldihydropteridine diphosphokinase
MTDEIFLLLGTNLGNKKLNLKEAVNNLTETIGKITKLSRIYKTAAWGNENQPSFYNQVVALKTEFEPAYLLKELLAIEVKMGRVREEKWGARIIDIDILFYGKRIVDTPALSIPHPEIQNRKFTLLPLQEINPEFIHPVLNKSIKTLLLECPDKLEAIPYMED